VPGTPLMVATRIRTRYLAAAFVLLSDGCYHPSHQLALYEGAERLGDGPYFEYQRSRTDCGVAAAVMMLRLDGQQVDYDALRRGVRLSRNGLSLAQIRDVLREHNLDARGLRLDPSRLDSVTLPVIAWLPMRHVVVLEAITADSAVISDPGRGRWKVSRARLSRAWSGTALVAANAATRAPLSEGRSDTARKHSTRGFHP
jgi:ABC-type bacteriocin/lantibiotic exporter with double-glycine peptidase domain